MIVNIKSDNITSIAVASVLATWLKREEAAKDQATKDQATGNRRDRTTGRQEAPSHPSKLSPSRAINKAVESAAPGEDYVNSASFLKPSTVNDRKYADYVNWTPHEILDLVESGENSEGIVECQVQLTPKQAAFYKNKRIRERRQGAVEYQDIDTLRTEWINRQGPAVKNLKVVEEDFPTMSPSDLAAALSIAEFYTEESEESVAENAAAACEATKEIQVASDKGEIRVGSGKKSVAENVSAAYEASEEIQVASDNQNGVWSFYPKTLCNEAGVLQLDGVMEYIHHIENSSSILNGRDLKRASDHLWQISCALDNRIDCESDAQTQTLLATVKTECKRVLLVSFSRLTEPTAYETQRNGLNEKIWRLEQEIRDMGFVVRPKARQVRKEKTEEVTQLKHQLAELNRKNVDEMNQLTGHKLRRLRE